MEPRGIDDESVSNREIQTHAREEDLVLSIAFSILLVLRVAFSKPSIVQCSICCDAFRSEQGTQVYMALTSLCSIHPLSQIPLRRFSKARRSESSFLERPASLAPFHESLLAAPSRYCRFTAAIMLTKKKASRPFLICAGNTVELESIQCRYPS